MLDPSPSQDFDAFFFDPSTLQEEEEPYIDPFQEKVVSTPQDDEDLGFALFGEPHWNIPPGEPHWNIPPKPPEQLELAPVISKPLSFPINNADAFPFDVIDGIWAALTKDSRFRSNNFAEYDERGLLKKDTKKITDHMSALYLWGSHLWGTNHEDSDYDFVLLLNGPCRLLEILSKDQENTIWTHVVKGKTRYPMYNERGTTPPCLAVFVP